MIRLAGESDLPALREIAGRYPAASVRIETALALYGMDERRILYWIGGDSGEPDIAVCLADGALTVAAGEATEELCAFVRATPYAALEGPLALCERLRAPDDTPARVVMTFSGEASPREMASPRPEEAYRLICEVMGWPERDPAWSGWYVQLSALLRHERGMLRGIYEGGRREPVFIDEKCRISEGFLMPREPKKRHKADAYDDFLGKCGAKIAAETVVSSCEYRFLVSTAGVYATDARHALIGGVATLPAYCGRGYAGGLVAGLCHEITAKGRTPLLLCGTELEGFYRALGFRAMGQWGQITAVERAVL